MRTKNQWQMKVVGIILLLFLSLSLLIKTQDYEVYGAIEISDDAKLPTSLTQNANGQYEIRTPGDLLYLSFNAEDYHNIILMGILDMRNIRNFMTIRGFSGTFDGNSENGAEIRNLKIDESGTFEATGLFGQNSTNTVIKNLTIRDSVVIGDTIVGTIVGYSMQGFIENVRVYNGKVVGKATGSTGQNYGVGGIAGYLEHWGGGVPGGSPTGNEPLHDVSFEGTVQGINNVGGLVGTLGQNPGIQKVSAIGSVTGQKNVGGLFGQTGNQGVAIRNAYFIGDVRGGQVAGGIIGYVYPEGGGGQLNYVYASGTVTGNLTKSTESFGVGGIIGVNTRPITMNGVVALQETVTLTGSSSALGGAGRAVGNITGGSVTVGSNYLAFEGMTPGSGIDFPSAPNYSQDVAHNANNISKDEVGNGMGDIFGPPFNTGPGQLPSFDGPNPLPPELLPPALELRHFADIADLVYTGQPLEPMPILSADGIAENVTFNVVEWSSNINVGQANIVVEGSNNWSGQITLHFNIIKATPEIPPISLEAFEGQTLADLASQLPSGVTFDQPLSTSVGPVGTNIFMGSYLPSDPNNYITVNNIMITVLVKARTVVQIPTSLGTLQFLGNNNEQQGIMVNISQWQVYFDLVSGDAISQSAIGVYTSVFGLLDPITSVWSDGSIANITLTFEIVPALTVLKGFGSVAGITDGQEINYNTPINLSIAYINNPNASPYDTLVPNYQSIIFEFSADGGLNWQTMTPVNVGTYLVRARLAGDIQQADPVISGSFVVFGNPSGINQEWLTDTISFMIVSIDPTRPASIERTATFGSTLASISLPAGITFNQSLSTLVGSLGTHTFMATFTPSTANYNPITDIEVIITVVPILVNRPQAITGLKFNNGWQTGTTAVGTVNIGFTLVSGSVERAINAGTYQATYRLNAGYAWLDSGTFEDHVVHWTIVKDVPNISSDLMTIFVGQNLASIILTDYVRTSPRVQGEFSWTSADINTPFNTAGLRNFNVTFTPTDSANEAVVTFMVLVMVIDRVVVVRPTPMPNSPFTWTGNPITGIDITQSDPSYWVMSGHDITQTDVGIFTSTFTLLDPIGTVWDNGSIQFSLTWEITASTEYRVLDATVHAQDVIFGSELDYSLMLNAIGLTDQNDLFTHWYRIVWHFAADNGGQPGSIVMSWQSLDGGMTWGGQRPTDAGSYWVRIYLFRNFESFEIDGNVNVFYNDFLSDWTAFRILPANSALPDLNLEFNAIYSSPLLNVQLLLNAEVINLGLDGTMTFNAPLSTRVGDVGERIFTATFTPSNFPNVLTQQVDIKIIVTPRAVSAPTVVTGLTYNGQLQLGINNSVSVLGFYMIVDGSAMAQNAGSHSVVFRLNNSTAPNLVWADGDMAGTSDDLTLTFNIGKGRPNPTIPVGLKGIEGQQLGSVVLPAGWNWLQPIEFLSLHNTQGRANPIARFRAYFNAGDPNYDMLLMNLDVEIVPLVRIPVPVLLWQQAQWNNTLQNPFDQVWLNTWLNKGIEVTVGSVSGQNVGVYAVTFSLDFGFIWANETDSDLGLIFEIIQATGDAQIINVEETYDYNTFAQPLLTMSNIESLAVMINGVSVLGNWPNVVFQFSSDNGVTWGNGNVPVIPGTYLVRALLSGSVNFANFTTVAVGFEIIESMPPINQIPVITLNATFNQTLNDVVSQLPSGVRFDLDANNLNTLVGPATISGIPNEFSGFFKHGDTNFMEVPITIFILVSPLVVNAPTLIDQEFIFNGESQTGVLVNAGFNNLYELVDGSVSVISAINAGNYIAVFRLIDRDNMVWDSGVSLSGSNVAGSSADLVIRWTIAKAVVNVTDLPQAIENLRYNNSQQTGVTFNNQHTFTNGLTIQSFTITDITGLNAGNYTATATINDNFRWPNLDENIKTITIEWEILRQQVLRPTLINDQEQWLYTGNSQTVIQTNGGIAGTHWQMFGQISATQVGDYVAQFVLRANFEWEDGDVEPHEIHWSIITQGITLRIYSNSVVYDSMVYAIASIDGVSSAFNVNGDGLEQTNVGSFRTVITLTPGFHWDNIIDYNGLITFGDPNAVITIFWQITPQEVYLPEAILGLTFNNAEQIGLTHLGVLINQAPAFNTIFFLSNGNFSATNVGLYNAEFTLVSSNFTWIIMDNMRATITGLTISVPWMIAGGTPDTNTDGAAWVEVADIIFGDIIDVNWFVSQDIIDAGHDWQNAIFQFRSVKDNNWSTNRPVNVGSYYVRAYLFLSSQYADFITEEVMFAILAYDVTTHEDWVTILDGPFTWTGRQIRPQITVIAPNFGTLRENIDFTLTFGANVDAGLNAGLITITGINNFTGLINLTFEIEPAGAQLPEFIGKVILYATFGDQINSLVAQLNAVSPLLSFRSADLNLYVGDATATGQYHSIIVDFTSNDSNISSGELTVYIQVERLTVPLLVPNKNLVFNGLLQDGFSNLDEVLNTHSQIIILRGTIEAESAGTYGVQIAFMSNNFQWADGSRVMYRQFEFSIARANWNPILTYNSHLFGNIATWDLTTDTDIYGLDLVQMKALMQWQFAIIAGAWSNITPVNVGSGLQVRIVFSQTQNFNSVVSNIVIFDITPRDILADLSIFTDQELGINPNGYDFNFGPITPRITIPGVLALIGNLTLIEGRDFTLTYSNNINAGIATITIRGIGNYTGVRIIDFMINRINPVGVGDLYRTATFGDTLGSIDLGNGFSLIDNPNTLVGDATVIAGFNHAPNEFRVLYTSTNPNILSKEFTLFVAVAQAQGQATMTQENFEFTQDGWNPQVTIITGDYNLQTAVFWFSTNGLTFSQLIPTNAGTYFVRVTLSATNNFKEVVSELVEFVITPKDISTYEVTIGASFVYSGNLIEPHFWVAGGTLFAGLDFTFSFINNLNVGTATLNIEGINNFFGHLSVTFEIVFVEADVRFIVSDQYYSGNPFDISLIDITIIIGDFNINQVEVLFFDANANLLSSIPVNVGLYFVVLRFAATLNFEGFETYMVPVEILAVRLTDSMTQHTNGLIAGNFIYNGLAQVPTINLTFNDLLLTEGLDFSINFINNVNAGMATVRISAIDSSNFMGHFDLSFMIIPATIQIKALSGQSTVLGTRDPNIEFEIVTTMSEELKQLFLNGYRGSLSRAGALDPQVVGSFLINLGTLSHDNFSIELIDAIMFEVTPGGNNAVIKDYWPQLLIGLAVGIALVSIAYIIVKKRG